MSVVSSWRESEGCVSPWVLVMVVVGFRCPLPCPNKSARTLVSLFHPLYYMSSNGRVSDFESLIQNFRKSSAPPSRELPPNTPLFIILPFSAQP